MIYTTSDNSFHNFWSFGKKVAHYISMLIIFSEV